MKVLHLCAYFQTSLLYDRLFEQINHNGLDQSVFNVLQKKSVNQFEVGSDSYKLKQLPSLTVFHRAAFFAKRRHISQQLKRSGMLSDNPDLMHAHTLFSDGAIAYDCYRSYSIPYIVAVRNTDLNVFLKYKPYLHLLASKILSESKAVICISPIMRSELIKRFPNIGLDKKIKLIPNGIDQYWFDNALVHGREAGDPSEHCNALYVGKINQNKNLTRLISALSLLRNKGLSINLVIHGSLESSDPVLRRSLTQSFVKVGPHIKDKQQLRDIYRSADIFVMPSLTETFGLVYPEAMSQGLPVLYSKKQGFDGWFEEGVCGVSVDPCDLASIAKGIEIMIGNQSKMSHGALQGFQQFNWPDIASRYLQIYKRVVH